MVWAFFSFFLWVPSLEVVLINTTGTLEREADQEEGRPTQLQGGGLSGQSLGGSHAGCEFLANPPQHIRALDHQGVGICCL